MGETNASTARKPGRKAETPAQRVQRLERDIKVAKQAAKQHRERNLAAMATALLVEANNSAEFSEKLREVLPRRVTSKAALTEIMALFAG